MSTEITLPPKLSRLRTMGVGVAALAIVISLILMFIPSAEGAKTTLSDRVFQAYLYSFILWCAVPLGSLAFLMIHHMTGGAWSFVTQRIMEAATRTLPLVALLFVPILLGPILGLNRLYDEWVYAEAGSVVANKSAYLNVWFWAFRSVLYFSIWIGMAYIFNLWSKRLDETGDGLIVLKFRRAAPVGLIVYCLTTTFAATDWVMSVEPEWFSTIYGPLFWMTQGLTTLAFCIIILSHLSEQKPLAEYIEIDHYHHLGNLMMGFTVLWAYMSFSQYLITWSGNLPEEIAWYHARMEPSYIVLGLGLMSCHFFIPVVYLLFRRNKRNVIPLRRMCYWILFWRLVDVFWVVNPGFSPEIPGIDPKDVLIHIVVFVGMGGLWLSIFLGKLKERPLLSLNDPRLYDAIAHRKSPEAVEHA